MNIKENESSNELLERDIELLRMEHLRVEKMKKNAEALAKQKAKNRYGAANRFKGMINKNNEYTMDFTGTILPVVPLQMNKCKMIPGSIIKARISEEAVTDLFNYKENIQTVGGSEGNLSGEFEKTFNDTQNHVTNKLSIEPNYGVIVRMADEVKAGPNIMQDPNIVTRTGYRKSKSEMKNRMSKEGTRGLISQESDKRYGNASIDKNLQHDLVISQSINPMQGLRDNKAIGTVPTGAVSYAKYKRSMSGQRGDQAKVIVQKEELAMNMQLVEEYSGIKMKRHTISRESTVQKNKGSPRQLRQRSALTSSYSKYRMPPPPIGKTLGHGLFMSKI